MKTTKIHIEKFRGFQNEDFELGSQLTAITFQVRLDLGIVAIVYAFYIIIWNLYVMLQARRLETAIREKINSELEN